VVPVKLEEDLLGSIHLGNRLWDKPSNTAALGNKGNCKDAILECHIGNLSGSRTTKNGCDLKNSRGWSLNHTHHRCAYWARLFYGRCQSSGLEEGDLFIHDWCCVESLNSAWALVAYRDSYASLEPGLVFLLPPPWGRRKGVVGQVLVQEESPVTGVLGWWHLYQLDDRKG
jgi:hypothetical protein